MPKGPNGEWRPASASGGALRARSWAANTLAASRVRPGAARRAAITRRQLAAAVGLPGKNAPSRSKAWQ